VNEDEDEEDEGGDEKEEEEEEDKEEGDELFEFCEPDLAELYLFTRRQKTRREIDD